MTISKHDPKCSLLSTATALNGRFALATLSSLYGLGSQKFPFHCGFLSVHSWLAFLQSDPKAQISSHDIFLRFLHFDHRTTLAYQHFWERIYAREMFFLSSARSFFAWLGLLWSVLSDMQALLIFCRNKSRGPRTLAWRVCFFSLFLSNRLCSLVNSKSSLLRTIRRLLRSPSSLLLLVRCCLYLTFN